ncbi:MAG: hypothetical protein AABW79_05065 [Nanoarchaeota archaeon]
MMNERENYSGRRYASRRLLNRIVGLSQIGIGAIVAFNFDGDNNLALNVGLGLGSAMLIANGAGDLITGYNNYVINRLNDMELSFRGRRL